MPQVESDNSSGVAEQELEAESLPIESENQTPVAPKKTPVFHHSSATLPEEVVSTLDTCYQGAGSIWFSMRPAILSSAKLIEVKEGQTLFSQGFPLTHLYVIVEGEFQNPDTDEPLESALGLDDSLTQDTYSVTATAMVDSSVYQFPIKAFRYPPQSLSAAAAVLQCPYLKTLLSDRSHFHEFLRDEIESNTPLTSTSEEPEMLIIEKGAITEDFEDGTSLRSEKGDWVAVGNEQVKTCKTDEATVVYRVKKHVIAEVFQDRENMILWKSEFLRILVKHELLGYLEEERRFEILKESKFIHKSTEKILASTVKSRSSKIFTVLRGAISYHNSKRALAKPGDMYNFKVLTLSPYYTFQQDIVAVKGSVIVVTPRNAVYRHFKQEIKKKLALDAALELMESVELFVDLPQRQMRNLAHAMELRNLKNTDYAFYEKTAAQYLFILLAGQIVLSVGGKRQKMLVPYEYFGEAAINPNSQYPVSARAVGPCICWSLNIYQFGPTLEDVRLEFKRRLDTGVFRLTADQLLIRKILNNPAAHRTVLATAKQSNTTYCIIIYSKTGNTHIVRAVDTEIDIMKQLSSPFLPYLYAEMSTESHRIVVVKFEEGISLRNLLNRPGSILNEEAVKMYIGGILLGLMFMHNHGMLYLNLSPDTVYICKDGLPKLMQFHGSQYVLDIHRQSLLVTTYSAPEITEDGVINYESDIYSLGVLMFELICCSIQYPVVELTAAFIKKTLKNQTFCNKVTSAAISLMRMTVLERDVNEITCESLMERDWFGTVDWNQLKSRSVPVKLYRPSGSDVDLITKVSANTEVTLAEYVREDLKDEGEIQLANAV